MTQDSSSDQNRGPRPEFRRSHHRQDPMHGVRQKAGLATIVFVTACTHERNRWLATDIVHESLRRVWSEASLWLVGRYVIMPDHVHMFVSPGAGAPELEVWMRNWKHIGTRKHALPKGDWQQGHWDVRMRCVRQYEEKWDYVLNNPVRHGLVAKPDEWKYRGVLHELVW